MIHVGVDLTFSQVEDVLAACVTELERNKEKIANPGPKDDVEQVMVSCRISVMPNILSAATSFNMYRV
jgi:hypothetical protein